MIFEARLVPPNGELVSNPTGFNTDVNENRSGVSLWGIKHVPPEQRWSKGIAVIDNQVVIASRTQMLRKGLFELSFKFRFSSPELRSVKSVVTHPSGFSIATLSLLELDEESQFRIATTGDWEKIGRRRLSWFGPQDPEILSKYRATFETR